MQDVQSYLHVRLSQDKHSYISNPFRCTTCATLLDPVKHKSDSHMLTYIISSTFFLTLLAKSPYICTGVSAPEALVLICARNDLFCYNRIGWRRGCVSGMSGVCLWREFTFQRSKSATQRDEITPLHLILDAER